MFVGSQVCSDNKLAVDPQAVPREDTLIFSYIRRLRPFFVVQNFKYFFGFSEKIILLGYEYFVDSFLGHHKIELVLGVISMYFRGFS